MKLTTTIFSAAVLCGAVFSTPSISRAEEAEKPWTVDTTVGFYSDYMFRGFNLYDGASIQPSATLTYDTGFGKIAGNLWMHLSAEGDRQEEKFTEMDETISYAYALDNVTLKVGHIWYNYPEDSDDITDTAEFFANVVLDDSEINTVFPVTPSFSFYEDYRQYDTQYYELGFSHLFEPEDTFGKGFNITPYVNFGFASNAEKVYADSGLVQITYGVSSTLALGDFAIIPSLNYTHESDDNATNEFWFGATANYSF